MKADQRTLQAALDAQVDVASVSRHPVHLGDLVPIPLATDRKIRDAVEAEMLSIAVEQPRGLGLSDDLRHLSGQVERQLALDVDQATDRRFMRHLSYALRDLAADAAGLR
ncbi:hypothetical protein [Bosea sp. (in: a-proteobacteria)]|uniref:hypothetical protein n=1 Tax=Bosea sp. (in: a-proteobacteria) TaxID=1871050 RepID=UPI0025BA5AEF|nr:hypothetical protein [Bosea sp. (in: a-proteobacteria)]